MLITPRVLLVCCLFIIFQQTVDATIEIIDPLGRRVAKFFDREDPLDEDFEDIEGFIVTSEPADACLPVEEPPFLTNFTYGKFALINGSDTCSLQRKVHYAGQAGFDFAIVYDDPVTGSHIYHTFGFEPHIPAVLITFEDSLIIRNYLYNNSSIYNYRIRVLPNIPDLSYYMYLFGTVIGICLFVMILFMMCLCIKCIQERRRLRRNRLSSRQIKQIPTAKFSKGDQYDVCAICLDDYNEGDKLRILPCSHAYHAKCIDPWLMNNRRNCPLCKRKITFGGSSEESESEDSELTSPTESSPLLPSPSSSSPQQRGTSWGTFVNTVRTMTSTGGPSSMPDISPSTSNFQRRPLADNELVPSDAESDYVLPSPHFSVNNEKVEGAACSNHVEVRVGFINPFEDEIISNHAATI